jgi:PmbA protein
MTIETHIAPPAVSTGFAWSRDRFQQLVEDALAYAKGLGAATPASRCPEGVGLSVSVRKGEVENVERNRDKSIGVSVYIGKRRGNASTSDFSRAALEQTVRAAYDIARFTAEDPAPACPRGRSRAGDAAARDLDLFHPWDIDAEGPSTWPRAASARAGGRPAHHQSEGAAYRRSSRTSSRQHRGFRGGYASSRHSLSVAPIASVPGTGGDDMQRDAWYSSMRAPSDLARPRPSAATPPSARLSRLQRARSPPARCRCCSSPPSRPGCSAPTCRPPAAARCTASRASCSIAGQAGAARAHRHPRRPARRARQGQRAVRRRGRRHARARRREGGVVQGYFLSSYSARKLGMRTTGHAGGSQNLRYTSSAHRGV